MTTSSLWGRWGRNRRWGGWKRTAAAQPGPASNGNGGGTSTGDVNGTATGNGRSEAEAAAVAADHVAILLHPGLEAVAPSLQEELGPGFAVVIWPVESSEHAGERSDAVHGRPVEPSEAVIAVLDATADSVAAITVARQRHRHPQAGMLVVASRTAAATSWRTTADLLDAGADDVLSELNTRELAARLKALARRRRTEGADAGASRR